MASKFVNQIYRLLDHQRIKKKLRFNPFFLGIFPLAWPHTSSTIRSFDFEAPFEVSTFLKWNTFFFTSWVERKKMDKLTLSSVLASIPLMGYVFFPWYVPCTTGANIFLKQSLQTYDVTKYFLDFQFYFQCGRDIKVNKKIIVWKFKITLNPTCCVEILF